MLFRVLFLNRFRILLSDWRFLLALVVLPLFLSVVAGDALDRQKRTEMSLLVADQDGSRESDLLVKALKGKKGLAVAFMEEEMGLRRVEDNQAEAFLLIPKGYGERFRQGDLEGVLFLQTASSADSRGFLTELVAGEVFRLSGKRFTLEQLRQLLAQNGQETSPALEAEVASTYERLSGETWLSIAYVLLEAEAPEEGTVNYPAAIASSLGLVVLFLLFGILFGAGWLVEDRRNGTLARLYAAHGPSYAWYAANWLALTTTGGVLATLLMAGAWLLAGEPPVRGLASWALLFCYIACLSSLSMWMSTVFPTVEKLQAATPVISIVSGFAGGCLWNQMGSVGGLPWVALATPQGWVLQALGRVYANPDTGEWATAAWVLCGTSLVLGIIGWVRLRRMVRGCS